MSILLALAALALGWFALGLLVDKPWVAPDDGAKLGVLVSAMGFIRP